jgi:hypothetical protein
VSGAAAQDLAAQAVQADEERIARELVDTVIRDLYLVGLTLASASQRDGEPQPPRVVEALDGIDHVIRTIRGVVFDLDALRTPQADLQTRLADLDRRMVVE